MQRTPKARLRTPSLRELLRVSERRELATGTGQGALVFGRCYISVGAVRGSGDGGQGMHGTGAPRCSGKAKNEALGQLIGGWLRQVCPALAL